MGASNSKAEKTVAMRMCKERKRLIKQSMDSRYRLAAAHLSYIQSLRNIGISLRRFAEAEILMKESSLSPSQNTPSHSSYPSPSPSQNDAVSDSPVRSRLSYMKSGAGAAVAVTVRYNPSTNAHSFVDDDESMAFPMPPPPPPPPDNGSSWDYFDASDQAESFRFVGPDSIDTSSSDSVRLWAPNADTQNPRISPAKENASPQGALVVKEHSEGCSSKREKGECPEREDPSEFITHRAKDFLSSIKDIEHRFFRASESGKEVARMLEGNNIRVGYAEAKGTSSSTDLLAACPLVCCRGRSVHASHEPVPQNVPKIIIWNRSMSSLSSSSSRNPLATASKDDVDDTVSECVEDFCMISGSHSSTLDRLYAWERKLYDEVKASEVIRKEYDRKCNQLRHQFAKDLSVHVIDKTRAAIKDLHSRIIVALHAVDAIAKRIEKMRDEELQPQLTELIQGFIRMWKAMLESHHAQYITISLAYHARSTMGSPAGDARKQIMAQLQYEFECFDVSFADWMNSHTCYVEALNGWLQNCVLQPQERSRGSRKPFSPRRSLAPPIFVLCRDWCAGIKSLPSTEVSDAIRSFLSDLHHLMQQQQQQQTEDKACSDSNGDLQGKDEETSEGKSGNLGCIHTSMTKVLDKLTKFSEASLKLYEEIRQRSEAAQVAYSNPRPYRY